VRELPQSVDAELAAYLREWRREASKREGVPAYVVMRDSPLEDPCRKRPRSLSELRHVSGFGERKTVVYGSEILAVLDRFEKGARGSQIALPISSEARQTLRLLQNGHSLDELAKIRGVQRATIDRDAAELVEAGSLPFDTRWVPPETLEKIRKASEKAGLERLSPIKAILPIGNDVR
jgi:ATP-dependent DNA helicase RecQ